MSYYVQEYFSIHEVLSISFDPSPNDIDLLLWITTNAGTQHCTDVASLVPAREWLACAKTCR